MKGNRDVMKFFYDMAYALMSVSGPTQSSKFHGSLTCCRVTK